MSTNKKDNASEKKGRVKISKLRVNKETVKDLTDKEAERIKGGYGVSGGVNCARPSQTGCSLSQCII